MIKKTISYVDFLGNKKVREVRFHMSKDEILKWETQNAIANEDGTGYTGGVSDMLKKVSEGRRIGDIISTLEDVLERAYGELSEDGETFEKSPEGFAKFQQHASYEPFFLGLLENEGAGASELITKLMPDDLANEVSKVSDRPDPAWRPQAPQAGEGNGVGNPMVTQTTDSTETDAEELARLRRQLGGGDAQSN